MDTNALAYFERESVSKKKGFIALTPAEAGKRVRWLILHFFNQCLKAKTIKLFYFSNGTARFKKCKQSFECQHYSYLKTSDGQSTNLYLNAVHCFNPVLIRHLWQLKTVLFLHWCVVRALLLMPRSNVPH
jgi:hypothetical protein